MNLVCDRKDGGIVRIINCNYEYVLLQAETASLSEQMTLLLPQGEMQCSAVPAREGLYHVDNWQELLFARSFETLFALSAKMDAPSKKNPEP